MTQVVRYLCAYRRDYVQFMFGRSWTSRAIITGFVLQNIFIDLQLKPLKSLSPKPTTLQTNFPPFKAVLEVLGRFHRYHTVESCPLKLRFDVRKTRKMPAQTMRNWLAHCLGEASFTNRVFVSTLVWHQRFEQELGRSDDGQPIFSLSYRPFFYVEGRSGSSSVISRPSWNLLNHSKTWSLPYTSFNAAWISVAVFADSTITLV